MSSQEHPLLKLWNECERNITSAKQHHLIRCIPVYAGIFIEEFAVALNETTKNFSEKVIELGGRKANPFSTVRPGDWIEWFIDYCICMKYTNDDDREQSLEDQSKRNSRAGTLKGYADIQKLFEYRNKAAHFNNLEWKKEEPILLYARDQLGSFCKNLLNANKKFSEQLRTSLITQKKSKVYGLNGINKNKRTTC